MLTERMPQENEHKTDASYRKAIKAMKERLAYRDDHMELWGSKRGSAAKKATVTIGKRS